jgi:hypothetical protein
MSSLGSNGRFANQLFQYLFLVLYSLRSGCNAYAPDCDAVRELRCNLALPMRKKYLPLPWLKSAEASFLETTQPPRDVDLWGYFQVITRAHRTHKAFIKEILRPSNELEDALESWLKDIRTRYRRIIGLHIRRGDYAPYDPDSLCKFSRVPTEFYLDWLSKVAREGDAIFVSTDADEELARFAGYTLLNNSPTRPDVLRSIPGDFFFLTCCDVVAYCNSSWSFMAALMAADSQEAHIIDFQKKEFVQFDPWSERSFWLRFEPSEDGEATVSSHDANIQMLTHYAKLDQCFQASYENFARYAWSRILGGKGISVLFSMLPMKKQSSLRKAHLAARERYLQYKQLWRGPLKAG